jgi:hypothetical protein
MHGKTARTPGGALLRGFPLRLGKGEALRPLPLHPSSGRGWPLRRPPWTPVLRGGGVSDAASAARQGTEKRQRGRLVAVRCTDAELASIAAAAARVGMTVGAFLRHQAIGTPGPRAIRRPQVDRVELAGVSSGYV